MADWKTLYEKFDELSEDLKKKLRETFLKKPREKLEELFTKEPYARRVYENLVSIKPTVIPTEIPTEIPTQTPTEKHIVVPKLGEEIKTGPRFKPGDKVTYRWTGEEYTIKAVTSWPSVLVEDRYGHLIPKDEFQLLTAEEYERLKEQEKREAEEKKKAVAAPKATPRLPAMRVREREAVLRDIFYAALSEAGVPIKEGYRARWRIRLPELLRLPVEEQESQAGDFAAGIVAEYQAEQKGRREKWVRAARPLEAERKPLALPLGWKPVEGGYLVNGRFVTEEEAPSLLPTIEEAKAAPAEERMVMTNLVRRRCPDPDHENSEWVKAHPEVEEQWPQGEFLANIEEERTAHIIASPTVYRNRRFLKYCPYHRNKLFGVWLTTFGKWVEVYGWMFKVSGGRQGFNPDYLINAYRKGDTNLRWKDYDRPLTWHPPKSVLDYWRNIGWAIPAKIEMVWAQDLGVEEEFKRGEIKEIDIFKLLIEEEERKKRGKG